VYHCGGHCQGSRGQTYIPAGKISTHSQVLLRCKRVCRSAANLQRRCDSAEGELPAGDSETKEREVGKKVRMGGSQNIGARDISKVVSYRELKIRK